MTAIPMENTTAAQIAAPTSCGGRAGQLIGIDTATPMPAFIPVLMFAVLFGLSMDCQVFLISRMRESWLRTSGHAARAALDGLAGTGRVITAAAAIMVAAFAAFVPSPEVVLKAIGVGMAPAIAIDATVVRMLLVPAIMHLLGRANWWLPRSVDRRLPQLRAEGRPEAFIRVCGPRRTTPEAVSQSRQAPSRRAGYQVAGYLDDHSRRAAVGQPGLSPSPLHYPTAGVGPVSF